MNYIKKVLFLLITAALLMSCSKTPSTYFPMKVGDKWDFNFKLTSAMNVNTTTMTYVISEKTKLGDNEYYKFESTFGGLPEGMNKSVDYYRDSPAGIVIKSPDTTLKDELTIIPAGMKVGSEWDANYPAGKRHYKLASFEDVTIGDQTYKDCVKIEYEDNKNGQKDSGYFCFAKDVGLVKIHIDSQHSNGTQSTTEATLAKFSPQ